VQENIPVPASAARKRKGASPAGTSGPLAKRPAGRITTTAAAPSGRRAGTATATAPSAAAAGDGGNTIWDAVAEETGWAPADCLAHKLAFPKRADAKAKVEALVQHVRRLRAAGWHLHDAWERAAADVEALTSALQQEEAAHGEDKDAAEAALRAVQAELGAAAAAARRREAELTEHRSQVGAGAVGWLNVRLRRVLRRTMPASRVAGASAYESGSQAAP
jgi:hypothetical protein